MHQTVVQEITFQINAFVLQKQHLEFEVITVFFYVFVFQERLELRRGAECHLRGQFPVLHCHGNSCYFPENTRLISICDNAYCTFAACQF